MTTPGETAPGEAASDDVLPALFTSSGEGLWTATEYARGPWDPRHCHGGPVSALLARACEQTGDSNDTDPRAGNDIGHDQTDQTGRSPSSGGVRAPSDWQITRLTIELTRPVPVGVPLALASTVERPGRKVSVVAASLTTQPADGATGVEVAKVRALRIRRSEFELPEHPTLGSELAGTPGEGRLERVSWAADDAAPDTGDVSQDTSHETPIAFHSHGAEHRIVAGSWNDPGPISLWIRLATCVVAGEVPTGVQRAATAADFGNGVSSALDFADFTYINPDLTMHLARPPQGEWIGMVTHSVYGTEAMSTGAGFAESALHDELGRLGRSVQSLLVEPR